MASESKFTFIYIMTFFGGEIVLRGMTAYFSECNFGVSTSFCLVLQYTFNSNFDETSVSESFISLLRNLYNSGAASESPRRLGFYPRRFVHESQHRAAQVFGEHARGPNELLCGLLCDARGSGYRHSDQRLPPPAIGHIHQPSPTELPADICKDMHTFTRFFYNGGHLSSFEILHSLHLTYQMEGCAAVDVSGSFCSCQLVSTATLQMLY